MITKTMFTGGLGFFLNQSFFEIANRQYEENNLLCFCKA